MRFKNMNDIYECLFTRPRLSYYQNLLPCVLISLLLLNCRPQTAWQLTIYWFYIITNKWQYQRRSEGTMGDFDDCTSVWRGTAAMWDSELYHLGDGGTFCPRQRVPWEPRVLRSPRGGKGSFGEQGPSHGQKVGKRPVLLQDFPNFSCCCAASFSWRLQLEWL